ncbi:MAG: hypothetical protein JO257_10170 [Deltaproteobacteria bacterium]|nr:hypothetical protein [Deltaproteobacteria bacterium]
MGPTLTTKSATATSFDGADGAGTMVRGWRIDFLVAGPGTDCTDNSVKVAATVGIFTSQPSDKKMVATLPAPADIPIVMTSPPNVSGQAAANMGAEGVGNIVGTFHIDTFHLNAQSKPDEIDGTITAGGTDGTGNAVNITGTWKAPVCD